MKHISHLFPVLVAVSLLLGCAQRQPVPAAAPPRPARAHAYWWQYRASAVPHLQKRCDANDARSCGVLARLEDRLGPVWDPDASCLHFEKACALGDKDSCTDRDACRFRARQRDLGRSLSPDEIADECRADVDGACAALTKILVHQWFAGAASPALEKVMASAAHSSSKDCSHGDMEACSFVGWLHAYGLGVSRNRKQARQLISRACRHGYASACTVLGMGHTKDGWFKTNAKLAAALFDKSCRAGDADGCFQLAELRLDDSTKSNAAKSRELLERACKWGSLDACDAAAGLACSNPKTCSQRQAEQAFEYLDFGARHHDLQCTVDLAVLLAMGHAVRDEVRANALFSRACNFGSGQSCYVLAVALGDDSDSAQAKQQIAAYTQRACTLGYVPACRTISGSDRQLEVLRRER